jgi:hypothetical protein
MANAGTMSFPSGQDHSGEDDEGLLGGRDLNERVVGDEGRELEDEEPRGPVEEPAHAETDGGQR